LKNEIFSLFDGFYTSSNDPSRRLTTNLFYSFFFQMNYHQALTSSLPKVSASPPPTFPITEVQRQERMRIKREQTIREERMKRERELRQADELRESKHKSFQKKKKNITTTTTTTTYDHSVSTSRSFHRHQRPPQDSSPIDEFESTLRKYHRSLGSRLQGESKYVKHIVDPLIEAIDWKMGAHDNEFYLMLCQQSAETMTRQFCAEHPIHQFDTAITSGAMTKNEAIGILAFHPDHGGVERLKKDHNLSLTTADRRRILYRGKATGCLTKDQVSHLDFSIQVSKMLDLGFYGQALFMGGNRFFSSTNK